MPARSSAGPDGTAEVWTLGGPVVAVGARRSFEPVVPIARATRMATTPAIAMATTIEDGT